MGLLRRAEHLIPEANGVTLRLNDQSLRHLIFTDSDMRLWARRIRAGAGRARLPTIRFDAGR
jgi:hypothetical protein